MHKARYLVKKKIEDLNKVVNKLDLTDAYGKLHPKTAECTFSSSARGTFSRRDHKLDHKTRISKLKKIEMIQSSLMAMELN